MAPVLSSANLCHRHEKATLPSGPIWSSKSISNKKSKKVLPCRISHTLPSAAKDFFFGMCNIASFKGGYINYAISYLRENIVFCFLFTPVPNECMAPIRCSKMLEERKNRKAKGWKKQGRNREKWMEGEKKQRTIWGNLTWIFDNNNSIGIILL